MRSELENFESACEITVFPHPKAPGMAQVPPCTEGSRESRTRWPVISGVLARQLVSEGTRLTYRSLLDHRIALLSAIEVNFDHFLFNGVLSLRGDESNSTHLIRGKQELMHNKGSLLS